MIRIPKDEMQNVMVEKLIKKGVKKDVAVNCAEQLVENSVDGIYSHGVNRFPRIITYLKKGYIHPNEQPSMVFSLGAFEQWDGNLAFGNLNAQICMDRAIKLSGQYGIGCVAIRNTNHWMRGGAYGLQAAKAGCIGICWTNTQPNMPAWGGKDRRIGNNPLIMCVPYSKGHVMMDGAMAQFSYGAIESAKLANKRLPVPGGFDSKGNISDDPAEIEKTWRVLPIGYWKGSSISILMDMIAAILADGNSVCDVGKLSEDEYALSQVLIAIDIKKINMNNEEIVDKIIEDIKLSERADEMVPIYYPNEMSYPIREDNEKNGIPVNDEIWEAILNIQ
ncbi:MAG: 3-dehydro-L-gulonate 2-dehydrogenase [Sphaerochaetaceae bacterium]|nr:3-dehydro-L-gulonate 2-dehydrogenase [Sphaerochaetaceae bacterium]